MDAKKSWSVGFEFVDIEIIDHNESEKEKSTKKFGCDQCNMFFCNQEKLEQHQKEHEAESVKCRYCNKTLSMTEESKESYTNRKCETCEYRCSQCPQRFLRHSSLLNHEKNHILPRKRKTPLASKKCINGLKTPRNSEISKLLKKRKQEKPIEESDEEEDSITPRIGLKKKQKYRSESTDFDNSAANYNDRVIPNNSKEIKRLPFRASKSLGEEKLGAKKKKSSLASNNVSPAISSPLDNSVNYKPFSCHVCGDTFATDHDLLEHIRSHGEVAKSFRCKHCGDEFEDIYKMQFHLAVCPFAEDELDSSIKKPSIPHKTKTIPSPSATPRKRGRPRKVTVDVNTSTSEDEPEESVRKTKAAQTFMTLPKRIGRKRTYKPVLNESGSGIDQEESDSDNSENCDDPRLDEDYIPTRTKDLMDGGEDSKKVHACPFPRCAFKFTREKALLCHMRNHTDDFDEALKCHKCDTPFDDLQSLRTHIDECREVREETEETDDDFIESSEDPENDDENDTPFHKFQKSKGTLCRVCKRAYSSTAKLKRHEALHRSPNLECRICKGVFVNQLILDQHFSVKHPNKSPYHCEICNEDFISDLFLEIHKTEYHPDANLTESTIVDKLEKNTLSEDVSIRLKIIKSNTYSSVVVNNRFSSRNKSQLRCPVCVVRFDKRETLRLHIMNNHLLERDSVYVCELCKAEKPDADMMCSHLEVHSNNLLSVNRFSKLRACVDSSVQDNKRAEQLYQGKIKIARHKPKNILNSKRNSQLQSKRVKSKMLRSSKISLQKTKESNTIVIEQEKYETKDFDNSLNNSSFTSKISESSCSDKMNVIKKQSNGVEKNVEVSVCKIETNKINRLRKPLHRKHRELFTNSKEQKMINNKQSEVEVVENRNFKTEVVQVTNKGSVKERTEKKALLQQVADEKSNKKLAFKKRNTRLNRTLKHIEGYGQRSEISRNIIDYSFCEDNAKEPDVDANIGVVNENEDQPLTESKSHVEAEPVKIDSNCSSSSCESEEHYCSLCSKVFRKRSDLLNHVGTHI